MKNLTLLCSLTILCLFSACKKDGKVNTAVTKTITSDLVADSGSYTIAGKTYTVNTMNGTEAGNAGANQKIDSLVNYENYHIASDKDSVFFYRKYSLNNEAFTSFIQVSFFKKYSKNDMTFQLIYYPVNALDLFGIGDYSFAVDFLRDNAHNGVAIAVNGVGQSYADAALVVPTTITQASESSSKFQIITLKKLSNGDYLLEAKFNAVLFDSNENPIKLDNGYVRMTLH